VHQHAAAADPAVFAALCTGNRQTIAFIARVSPCSESTNKHQDKAIRILKGRCMPEGEHGKLVKTVIVILLN
jgi:hypothetical protein